MKINPPRGEVWRVELDPSRGAEMRKTRPAVVVNASGMGRLELRLLVPVIGWKPHCAQSVWMVRLDPDATNGLTKLSAADASQLRTADISRFVDKIGRVVMDDLDTIIAAAVLCLGYVPPNSPSPFSGSEIAANK